MKLRLLALALPSLAAHAETWIGLREAVATALKRNRDLAREAVDVGVADANLGVADGAFDFRLGADASVAREFNLFGSQTSGGWDAYLAKRLPTGGDLELRLDTQLSRTSLFFICGTTEGSDEECNLFTPSLRLRLTQPLLRGAWPAVALAPERKAEVARSAAGWRRAARAADVLRKVVQTYWELAFAARGREIRREALERTRKQLDLVRAEVAAGRVGPSDLLLGERAAATREEDVVLAEEALVERSLALARLMGARPRGEYGAADEPRPRVAPVDADARRAAAMRGNPSLRAAREDGRVREIDLEVARRSAWPRLDLVGSVGTAAQGDVYARAVERAFSVEEGTFTWSAALGFVYPLGNRAAEGAEEIARLERKRSDLTVADLEDEVAAQVERLAAAVTGAARRVGLGRRAARLARASLEAEEARFAAGQSRAREVLDRQDELGAAELREARAAVDYLVGLAALEAATGEILDRYGVAAR